ncbi:MULTISPECIES: ABC transporter permease [unclassified Streptomyces]|uniref:ABC transporter permease n=1 Tax=unclassified Streptomyces TaxID=2593676 RepID=UPI002034821F|nr:MULTISPECIES: ABC transporter permease [unclassified Streptomyces]MCM2423450.1 ABC transporter permease [Streptomyces sp. RKAG293]MCM2424334.1 ABC transporter permease [Streptomyces sp. RKAG337]
MSAYTALTRANYRAYVRDRTTVFFTFAFPLLFLVVFGLIFKGQTVEDGGPPYINYIAPGVLSWGVGNAAMFGVAFTLMHWRRDDILRLIWRTPTSLPSVLGSRYAVAVGVGLVQAALFVGIALLPLFGLHLANTWPLAVPVLVLGITTFMALGLVVGSIADTPEAVAAIANCIMVPMAFLSGSFYPSDLMPGFLRTFSRALPLRYFNDGIIGVLSNRGSSTDLAVACAGLIGFTAVFALIAAKTFRWSNRG